MKGAGPVAPPPKLAALALHPFATASHPADMSTRPHAVRPPSVDIHVVAVALHVGPALRWSTLWQPKPPTREFNIRGPDGKLLGSLAGQVGIHSVQNTSGHGYTALHRICQWSKETCAKHTGDGPRRSILELVPVLTRTQQSIQLAGTQQSTQRAFDASVAARLTRSTHQRHWVPPIAQSSYSRKLNALS